MGRVTELAGETWRQWPEPLFRRHDLPSWPRRIAIRWIGGTVVQVEAANTLEVSAWRRLEARIMLSQTYTPAPERDDDLDDSMASLMPIPRMED